MPTTRSAALLSRADAAIEHDLPGAVTADLADYLAGRRAECADIAEEYAGAVDDLTRFVLAGGKRLRPTFAWWGWRAAGGLDDPSAVLRAVSALELIQACALVHDDLIDDSATRRGEPTVHARWAARHAGAAWTGDPTRFGAAVAILLGDVALAWADDMLHESGVDPVALARARPAWQAMRTEVLGGQFLDVQGHASSDSSPETALRISRYKTAAYTVERPLHLGAAIAGADDTTIAALRRYGTDLGIAFQLRDDLLGVFGDPAVTGKPAGDDLREGKLTLLVALTRAPPRPHDGRGRRARRGRPPPRPRGRRRGPRGPRLPRRRRRRRTPHHRAHRVRTRCGARCRRPGPGRPGPRPARRSGRRRHPARPLIHLSGVA